MMSKGILTSSALSMVGSWIVKALGLISTIILARLLAPEDFGVVAICMLVIYFFDLLATTGTRAYILSLEDVSSSDINSAWTLDIFAKSSIAIIIIIFSGDIANYFANPILKSPIMVCSLIPILSGAENPKLNILRRNFQYKPLFKINVQAKIISFVITISAAYYLQSYWALVIGSVVSVLLITCLGYVYAPYSPRIDFSQFRKQWRFSKWIFSKAIVGYARAKTDTFILGKFFSLSDVGAFNIAKEFGLLVYEQIALPVSDIIMSGVQKNSSCRNKVASTIESYMVFLTVIVLPACFGTALLADEIVIVILGDKWIGAGLLLKPLSIFGFFVSLTAVLTAATNALRKVKSSFYLELVIALIAVFLLYFYRELEIHEFSIVVVSIGFVTFCFYFLLVKCYIPLSPLRIVVAILPCVFSTLCMVFTLYHVKNALGNIHVFQLIVLIFCGILSYALALYPLLTITYKKNQYIKTIKEQADIMLHKCKCALLSTQH